MTDVNFVGLFLKASPLVKGVMSLLLGFSVASWAAIIQRVRLLRLAGIQVVLFETKFWSGVNLTRLYQEAGARSDTLSGIERIFYTGFKEFLRLQSIKGCAAESVVEGAARVMRIAFNREIQKLEVYGPFLATVGSVSPYIGLLGTVWGILQAFIALGNVKQATLQMVAPSIAEALIATAIGLFAAIPAVVAYNRFSAQVNKIEQNYMNFVEEFTAILHRQAYSCQ